MAGYGGLDKQTSDEFFGGQKRTYTMWCNQKLMEAGENFSFSIQNLADEFTTGVNVARMLQILASGKRIADAESAGQTPDPDIGKNVAHEIGRIRDLEPAKMLPVYRRDNLNKCWKFMSKSEKISLGGINVPSIMSASESVVLALVFRWIKNYDLAEGYSELLEWVKSKTGNYTTVSSWSTSFQDGVAITELYSVLCSEHFKEQAGSVDDMLDMSPEDRLQRIFELIETGPLAVSQMLTTSDLAPGRLDNDQKAQLMTYIGAIRSAHAKWFEQKEIWEQEKNDSSKTALNDGDKYWKMGLQKFSNAREKVEPVITDIRSEIREDVKNDVEPNYESYVTTALERFDERMPEYDESIENFNKASDEYKKVTHTDVSEKISDCDEKVDEANQHRELNKKWLTDLLELDFEHNRAWRIYLEACDDLDSKVEEGVDFINDLVEYTVEQIKNTHTEEGMEELQRDAIKKATEWVEVFEPVREKFFVAEDTYPDKSIEEKRQCQEKRDEIDNTISQFLETVRLEVAKAFHDDIELPEDELLELYHKVTNTVDKLTNDDAQDVNLYEIMENPTQTKQRLDRILEQVRGVWGDSDNLRQKVHNKVDAIFNAYGYRQSTSDYEDQGEVY
jgi:hypothetical protein